MSHQVYKLEPGQCTCLLGDPYAGSRQVAVKKISGSEVVLEPTAGLVMNQFVYATVEFHEGPSLALSGLVVSAASGGVLVQWAHADPLDGDELDRVVREYLESKPSLVARTGGATSAPQEDPEGTDFIPVVQCGDEVESTVAASAPDVPSPSSFVPNPDVVMIDPGIVVNEEAPGAIRAPEREPSAREPSAREPVARKAAAPRGLAEPPPAGKPPSRVRKPRPATTGKDRSRPTPPSPREKLDFDQRLRQRARVVRSSALAARLDTVQVIHRSTIEDLIREAVEEAVSHLGGTMGEEEKRKLLEEAEESFQERLQSFRAEKEGLEAETRVLEEQLGKARGLLEEERKKVVRADQFTLSDAGMVELETRFERLIHRAISTHGVSEELQEDLRALVAKLLDDEREKIREKEEEAQSGKIRLLETKINRLAGSLDTAEREREKAQRLAAALESSGRVVRGNVSTAGLTSDDPRRERKLSLLKEIFEFNREIRNQLRDEGRLPESARRPAGAGEGTQDAADPGDLPEMAMGEAVDPRARTEFKQLA